MVEGDTSEAESGAGRDTRSVFLYNLDAIT